MMRRAFNVASPLARAIPLALLTLIVAPATALPLAASASEQTARFDIPAGPLGSVLAQFANRAGINLSFINEYTDGLQSRGLQGAYDVQGGLRTCCKVPACRCSATTTAATC